MRPWLRPSWTIARTLLLAVLLPIVLAIEIAIVAVYALPLPTDTLALGARPLRILDRHGELIAEVPAAGAEAGQLTPLAELPAVAVSAVIEAEDAGFWEHGGIDGRGVARAIYLDVRAGHLAYGGSTLTQQLARMLISPGAARSGTAKAREALLALRLEHAYAKRTILEQWFARAYFGNGAYGYGQAARRYFGRAPAALTVGEAVLLAVLPRAPSGYDPVAHLPTALRRRDHVLELLVQRGILTAAAAQAARDQIVTIAPAPDGTTAAPHFVAWIVAQLPADVRARGGIVHTTLDLALQRLLAARLADHVAKMAPKNLQQAAAVVLDSHSGDVLALIGSSGWASEGGQIDMALRRRHPGSALKPFLYAAAIERGDSPASIAFDVRDAQGDYVAPHGGVEHGPTRYRTALASSYNFAAVDVLGHVGVGAFMSMLRRGHVAEAPGDADDYGLRLALGAAKVRLLDLTAGYGFLVNNGRVVPPSGIDRVDSGATTWHPEHPPIVTLVSPTTAWLTMDMLADPEARRPGFGTELPLDLPFPVAAKTGTARGFADTWAVAVTSQVTVGVWAGSSDGSAMQGVVGMDGAAPIVRDALLAIARHVRLTLPARPDDVVDVEVCATSGQRPGPHCPRIHDVAAHPVSGGPCDWHHDDGHGHATVVYPPRARGWLERMRQLATVR